MNRTIFRNNSDSCWETQGEIQLPVGKSPECKLLSVGGACRLPPPPPPEALVSPGRPSTLQLLRSLKCHSCLMAALISCIRTKHTPVVSGYISSQGSVPTRTLTASESSVTGLFPSRWPPLPPPCKRGKKERRRKNQRQHKKIKTANGLIISPQSRSAHTASCWVMTSRLYHRELISHNIRHVKGWRGAT